MHKVGWISIVALLLLFTVKIGQAQRGERQRRVRGIWDHKRDEWLQNLPA
jgi:hypothetical protein